MHAFLRWRVRWSGGGLWRHSPLRHRPSRLGRCLPDGGWLNRWSDQWCTGDQQPNHDQ
ncbi:MAG: hypothetical protein NT075_31615 [Chloroflexi bacterium]|nr:hypothetical protein [Chloroflexota bacterium]